MNPQNRSQIYSTAWVKPTVIILSKEEARPKYTYCTILVISFIQSLKAGQITYSERNQNIGYL